MTDYWKYSLVGILSCVMVSLCRADPVPPDFYPAGHQWEGLPNAAGPWNVYAADPQHPLNRLHALLFMEEIVPSEIQAQLPSERDASDVDDTDFFVRGWYFQKRAGDEADRKVFGGDVRVSPVRSFTDAERGELLQLLAQFSTREAVEATLELKDPLVRLLLQWDVAIVWWQLEQDGSDDEELLMAMARTVAALSQPAATLHELPSGMDGLTSELGGGNSSNRAQPYLPDDFPPVVGNRESAWIEVERDGSGLFQPDRTLRAARTYLNAGDRAATEAIIIEAGKEGEEAVQPVIPEGTHTALTQTLIGFDEQLNPVVTPVVDEVRVRVVNGPHELSSQHPSSSRDGSSHWVYLRTRAASREPGGNDFRFVADTSQSLFLEYGTLKHATYAAQCALCHRTTNAGGQAPGGIRVLARHMKPHVAEGDERARYAEKTLASVSERLRERLRQEPVVALPPRRLPPRPEESVVERARRAEGLRVLYAQSASDWPMPHVDAGVDWKELGPLPEIEHPVNNPHTKEKETLGRLLFFDPRLSGSGQLACASCHDPDLGWADGRTASFGHSRKPLDRNSPSLRNVAYHASMFWDGRAKSLEEQAEQVLLNPDEMRAEPDAISERLNAIPEYRQAFHLAFGEETITIERIAAALACYERTIVGGRSRFDAFLKGKPEALTDEAIRGMDLFRRHARCMNCHHGPLLSDGQFHNLGLSYYGRKFEDLGRYQITGEAEDVGKFRTPSLRDVTSTGPYMHNGLFELSGVLNMYNAGMATLRRKPSQADDPLFPVKSRHLKPLGLNQQDLDDLTAFLRSLEEPKRRIRPPVLPGLHEVEMGN